MAIVNGWCDWCERHPGHPLKVYSQPNSGEGVWIHSVVGNLPNHAVPSRFLSDARNPDGTFTRDAAASTMFIAYKDGHVKQMYPVTASTWTSGGREANTSGWAIEFEGGPLSNTTEALTKGQEDALIRIVTDWEAHTGRVAQPRVNILQHKDLARKYGYASTSCASDRCAGAYIRIANGERYGKEEGMASKEYDELLARIEDGELAMASGAEDTGTRGERLFKARYRIGEIAAGRGQSYGDRATSAVVLSKRALAAVAALSAAAGVFGASATGVIP